MKNIPVSILEHLVSQYESQVRDLELKLTALRAKVQVLKDAKSDGEIHAYKQRQVRQDAIRKKAQ